MSLQRNDDQNIGHSKININKIEELKFDDVFTFDNLFNSYKNCQKGVRWKPSTTRYRIKSIPLLSKTYTNIVNGRYRQKPFAKFTRIERGKARKIQALHISDRIVQKCYCDKYLVPLLGKSFIYDNGACMKNKGGAFTEKRIKCHLQSYYRTNGSNKGFILTFDFSKFFDSINHDLLLKMVRKKINDSNLYDIYEYFVRCFEGDKGLGLGSQISQVSALFFTNKIDHFVKEKLLIKFYARYMDDGYLISESKEKLKIALKFIKQIATELKLNLNLKKTRIWELENGFMFLNRHWRLTETGYVIPKPNHSTLQRLRKRHRKLKKKGDPDALKRQEGSINGFIKKFNNRRLEDYVYN